MHLTWRRTLGGVAWVTGLALALVCGARRGLSVEVQGVGFAPPVQVAPLESGRLQALHVGLHDHVDADEVVASVDPFLVLAERDLASATLLATQERLDIEAIVESRRFAESAEGSRLTRAELVSAIEEDEALLRTLREQLAIEQDLAARGASSGLMVDTIRWQLEVADARLRTRRDTLRVAEHAAASAEQRNAEAPVANDWELVAAARAVELVERRLDAYELRAGIDGHVTAIWAAPGSMVSEGLPILEIRQLATRDVVAYLEPSQVSRVAVGEPATVLRATGERLAGHLVSVGGSPQPWPLPIWPFPNDPRYGVPVRISLDAGEVAPDEPLRVRL